MKVHAPATTARGISLPEVLVSGVLIALLLGIVASTLLPGLRAWQRSDRQGDLQGNLALALRRLQREFDVTSGRSAQIIPRRWTPPGETATVPCDVLVLASPLQEGGSLGIDPDGQVLYRKRVIFYFRQDTQELWECHTPYPEPLPKPPTPLLAADLADALEATGQPPRTLGMTRRVARYLRSQRFEKLPRGACRVLLEVEREGRRSRLQTQLLPVVEALSFSLE